MNFIYKIWKIDNFILKEQVLTDNKYVFCFEISKVCSNLFTNNNFGNHCHWIYTQFWDKLPSVPPGPHSFKKCQHSHKKNLLITIVVNTFFQCQHSFSRVWDFYGFNCSKFNSWRRILTKKLQCSTDGLGRDGIAFLGYPY